MKIGGLSRCRFARIDNDKTRAAFLPRRFETLKEHRMAPGRIRPGQNEKIRLLEILINARHHILSKRAPVPGNGRGHAKAGIRIDIARADEPLHQLVGGIIVFRQKLARQIKGNSVRPMRFADMQEAFGDMIKRPLPALTVSPKACPFPHNLPKLAGCAGSPFTRTRPSRTLASTPQPTPQ